MEVPSHYLHLRRRMLRTLHPYVCLGLLLGGALASSPACMNDYRPNVAAIKQSRALVAELTTHPTQEAWPARRDRLRKLLAEGGDFRVKNDLATTLAHTGEAAEAVRLLEEIEAEKPGLYFTAANLGTAYELSGDSQRALEWIRKGIERNPEAHEGTEWLHVRILEAKIAIAGDADWLKTHAIFDVVNPVGNRGGKLAAGEVRRALTYQLHERLQFVPPPDPVVGALLVDLSEHVAAENSAGFAGAAGVVKLAADYLNELPGSHPLSERLVKAALAVEFSERVPNRSRFRLLSVTDGVLFVFGIGTLLSILVIRIKRRTERRLLTNAKKAKCDSPVHANLS